MGLSNDRNPPAASTPPAHRGRSPGSPSHSSCAGMAGAKPGHAGAARAAPMVACAELLHVAPVFLLQEVGKEREERQEQDHPDAQALALERGRFTGVLQESGDVTNGLVELDLVLGAGLRD